MRRSRLALLCMVFAVGTAVAGPKPEAITRYDDHFRKYAKHYFGVGTDWHWFKSQAIAESNLNPDAQSWVKARGLMQLMPATYAELQRKNPELGEITDPRWNIAAGVAYDKQLWDRYSDITRDDDRRRFMFAAYNAGAATMRRARNHAREAGHDATAWQSVTVVAPQVPKWRHAETLGYIERIEQFRAKLPPP